MTSGQALPLHYRSFYIRFIRLACLMAFFGLLSGILFQESTRKTTYSALGSGTHWEAVYHLALVHGHVFLIGVLIPLAVLGMLHLGLRLDGNVISARTLKWGGLLYHLGAGVAVLLMLYKGYHYVLSVRMGEMDFSTIEHHYFGGQHLIRQVVYGISHTSLGVGLGMLIVGIWKSLPRINTSP